MPPAELAGGCGFRRSLCLGGKLCRDSGSTRIEGIVDAAHQGEVGVGEEQGHEFALFHANAVLAGEAAADFDAIANDFGGGFQGALELLGVARIVEHDGVEIAITGVKDVADPKAELLTDLLMRRRVCGSLERGMTPSRT